jgi:hypothetical protein
MVQISAQLVVNFQPFGLTLPIARAIRRKTTMTRHFGEFI